MRNEEWWCGASYNEKRCGLLKSRKMRRPLEKGQSEGQG